MSDGGRSAQPAVSKKSFHFIAGLGSGLFTAVLLQPADLLKTRVQQRTSTSPSALQTKSPLVTILREIYASPHPFRQLWRGTTPSALRTGAGSALYFGWLNALRIRLAERGVGTAKPRSSTPSVTSSVSSSALPKLSNTANLITGAVARASAGFAMMPVTVIKVRYESSLYSYTSMWGASRDILRTEGLRGFFAGFGATAVRDAPYAGLYVLFYEAGKKEMGLAFSKLNGSQASDGGQERLATSTSAGINFASGVFAAIFATACTNPFDAIKTRLQLMPQRYGNMVRAAKMMLKEEGVRSMFDGLALRIGRKALSSALAWTVYEEIIRRAEVKLVEEKKIIS